MSRQTPRTPAGLGAAGRRLFREVAADVHETIELDSKDIQTLERAAVLADLVELLRQDVRERGAVVEGSTGRLQANPSIEKIGTMQGRIVQMLGTVRLDPEPAKTGGLGVKQRNRLAREGRRGVA
jgi:phage terminase small subunit